MSDNLAILRANNALALAQAASGLLGGVQMFPSAPTAFSRVETDAYGAVVSIVFTDGSRRYARGSFAYLDADQFNPAKVTTQALALGANSTVQAGQQLPDGIVHSQTDAYGATVFQITTDGTRRFAALYAKSFTTDNFQGSVTLRDTDVYKQGSITRSVVVGLPAALMKTDSYGAAYYIEDFDGSVAGAGLDAGGGTGAFVPQYTAGATSQNYWFASTAMVLIVVVLGQSNADAVNADPTDPMIATTPLYPTNALMPSTGVRVTGSPVTSLVPLVEDTNTSGRRESLCSGLVNHLINRVQLDTGITPTVITYNSAQTQQSIQNLGRGSAKYENHLIALRSICSLVRAQNKQPVVVGVYVQGESDPTHTPEYHRAALRQYARHFDADARAISQQSEPALLFLTQTAAGSRSPLSANYYDVGPPIATTWVDGEPLLRVAGPMYQFPISSVDGLHLKCAGQNGQGQQLARAIAQEYSGIGACAIKPVRCRWLSSTVCDVEFGGTTYDLALDPDGTITPTAATNNGFLAICNNASIAFTVSLPGKPDASLAAPANRVRFTFATAPTGSVRLYYAQLSDGSANGPVTGGRGTLCDTCQDQSLYAGQGTPPIPTYQRNWCLAFQFDLGRP